MAESDEYIPAQKKKKQDTNYALCFKCQTQSKDPIVKDPKVESIDRFIKAVSTRAECGDPEFVPILERISSLTSEELKEQNIVWHRRCYADTTNVGHIERAKDRHSKALSLEDTTLLVRKRGRPSASATRPTEHEPELQAETFTRSHKSAYNRSECFFCQGSKCGKLHMCRSHNVGIKIGNIVKASSNKTWKVNYADLISQDDALSRDILYHKDCMTDQWQKHQSLIEGSSKTVSGQSDEQLKHTVKFLAAEIQFYSQLRERLYNGEIIPIDSVQDDYRHVMREHDLTHEIERKTLRDSIPKHIEQVEISRPPNRAKPSLIHSTMTRDAAVDDAARRSRQEKVNIIFECAKLMRSAIEQSEQWSFQGSLSDTYEGTPDELKLLMKWIVQGHNTVQSDERSESINKLSSNLAQQIVQAHKSKRQITYKPKSSSTFRNRTETPLSVGMSLHCYHNIRSKKMLDMLEHAGTGISYHHTLERVNQIASAVQKNSKDHGAYIPPSLLKERPFVAAIDNIDAQVDTPDGKHSFHGLSASLFQQSSNLVEDHEYVAEPLRLDPADSTAMLKDVPKTAVTLETCTVIGNPKPTNSPHFPEFKPFSHQEPTIRATRNDKVWLMARYLKRRTAHERAEGHDVNGADENNNDPARKQDVAVWAAYNSQISISDGPQPTEKVHALPLINAPAHEWATLVTSLTHLHRINMEVRSPESQRPLCVWLDMDLYKRVRKLPFLQPENYEGMWIESPGQFHISLCALRCLGAIVEGSGLDTAWTEANMYSNITVMQILNGKHYKRAIECHIVTLEALTDLWLDTFFAKHPEALIAVQDCLKDLCTACETQTGIAEAHSEVIEEKLQSLDLDHLMETFDATNDKYPMYRWARMYMQQVTLFLQFLRSTRQRDWHLHLSSLEELCINFFAFNRLDYATHIPEYVARMYDLQQSNPQVWNDFEEGGFVVQTNPIGFTAIGVDHAQEHLNKVHKGDGGISGITTHPESLLRYCLSSPVLARLSQETEDMLEVTAPSRKQHHDLSEKKVQRQETNIRKLKEVLSNNNPFNKPGNEDGTENNLVHITNNAIIPQNVAENILDSQNRGKIAYQNFVEERISGACNLWEKMRKVKVLGWNEGAKPIKTKIGAEEIILRQSSSLLARLLVITRSSREIDFKEVIGTYELSSINHTLMSADGRLHPCNDKSKLMHELLAQVAGDDDDDDQLDQEVQVQAIPENTCLVIDGMAVVNEQAVLKSVIKNCADLANCFVQAIDRKSRGYESVCVVFDNYKVQSSLKETTRKRRTGGKSSQVTAYKVDDSTPIRDFMGFLSSTHTKDLLTLYLSQKVIQQSQSANILAVNRSGVLSNDPQNRLNILSNQEEADTLMILFASQIHMSGKVVHIYSSDTDVLVLALSHLPHIGFETKMIMGTGISRKYVQLEPIFHALGPNRISALVGLHAISGCDTTGRFYGKSKSAWWKSFIKESEAVQLSLSNLGIGDQPNEQVLSGCEEFMCHLFNSKTETFSDAKQLRWHQFRSLKANQGVEKLPPTQGAMQEHIRRAHLQCNVWNQVLTPSPTTIDPLTLGWYRGTSGELLPVLTKLPLAPESILQLVKCSCRTTLCRKRCSCRHQGIACTELCRCQGDSDMCNNVDVDVETSSDSDGD